MSIKFSFINFAALRRKVTMTEEIKKTASGEKSVVVESKEQNPLRIKFNVFRFEKRLTVSFSILIRIVLILSVAIALNFIRKELSNSNYSIQHISVPASFETAGYSGSVIANRIFNKLRDIIKNESLADVATEYKNANSIVDVNVDLVGIGVPVRGITGLLGDALGIKNRKEIRASIVLDGDTLILEINIEDDLERYEIPFKGAIESSLGLLTIKASEAILKHSSPYVLARYYLVNDSEGNYKLGKYLLSKYEGNPDFEPIGYFAWAGSYYAKSDYAMGVEIVKKGLNKYVNDLNLRGALGTMLRLQQKSGQALANDKIIIKMLTKRTPLLRTTLSYLNLGQDYESIASYDSAIYYGKKALTINKNYLDSYAFLSEMYFLKSDTTEVLRYLSEGINHGLMLENYPYYKFTRDPKIRAFLNKN